MDDDDLRLDGNALGGELEELFAADMTAASVTCTRCGRAAQIGGQHLYRYPHAPGAVLRCASCGNVLLVVVQRPGGAHLAIAGLRWTDGAEIRDEAAPGGAEVRAEDAPDAGGDRPARPAAG
jgi:hypothetical protein